MLTEEQKTQLKAQYNSEGSLMRNHQMGILKILIAFDDFCTQKEIKYSLSFGTLLGAIRHNGFIPWDDDADVMMTRTEYIKLKALLGDYGYLTDTLYVSDIIRPILCIDGCSPVDIFIVDNCPDNKILRWIKKIRIQILMTLLKCKERIIFHRLSKRIKPWFVMLPIAYILPFNWLKRHTDNVMMIGNKTSTEYVSIYDAILREIHIKYPSKLFDEFTCSEFEGHSFPILNDYDTFLSINYGDYMQVPDSKGRINNHRVSEQ